MTAQEHIQKARARINFCLATSAELNGGPLVSLGGAGGAPAPMYDVLHLAANELAFAESALIAEIFDEPTPDAPPKDPFATMLEKVVGKDQPKLRDQYNQVMADVQRISADPEYRDAAMAAFHLLNDLREKSVAVREES